MFDSPPAEQNSEKQHRQSTVKGTKGIGVASGALELGRIDGILGSGYVQLLGSSGSPSGPRTERVCVLLLFLHRARASEPACEAAAMELRG